jgi:hypothetical protein
MKSYFAKLAARATLANAPASQAVVTSKTADPFADEPVSDPASSPLGVAQPSHGPTQSVQTTRSQPLSKSEDVPRAQTERIDFDRGREKEERSRSLNDEVRVAPTVQSDLEITRDPKPHTQESRPRRDSQESKPESSQVPPQRIAPEQHLPLVAPPAISKETKETKPAANAGTDQRVAALQREQAVLMRKADAFMAGLFERRSEATQHQADLDEVKQAQSNAVVPREQPARLLPPKAPQVIEVADEQPSLVIGKLTVEVMSPAPPPPAPARQVVVVRGPGTGRRGGGFSSSQRFGLGQF